MPAPSFQIFRLVLHDVLVPSAWIDVPAASVDFCSRHDQIDGHMLVCSFQPLDFQCGQHVP